MHFSCEEIYFCKAFFLENQFLKYANKLFFSKTGLLLNKCIFLCKNSLLLCENIFSSEKIHFSPVKIYFCYVFFSFENSFL